LTGADEIIKLRPTGLAVGLLPKMNFISGQIQIDPGDILIAFTDGVTEAISPADKILGRKHPFVCAAKNVILNPSLIGLKLDRLLLFNSQCA
jgi:hypothetical protein